MMVTTEINSFKNQKVRKGEEITKRLYALKEAALYLGRGLHGVRDMVYRGDLPVVRNGRKMFIDIRDLDNFIEKNKSTYI
jgi:excisionase family DNA binding protein